MHYMVFKWQVELQGVTELENDWKDYTAGQLAQIKKQMSDDDFCWKQATVKDLESLLLKHTKLCTAVKQGVHLQYSQDLQQSLNHCFSHTVSRMMLSVCPDTQHQAPHMGIPESHIML